MKKKLIIIVIICLSLFIFRNSIIRQYFISKIEYVDYDEYILIDYLNGKKNKASYVGADFMVVLGYNEKEEVESVWVYDYDKKVKCEYNLVTGETDRTANNENRPISLNNDYLLELLHSKAKFKFEFIKEIHSTNSYAFEFRPTREHIITMYLDKELLYTVEYVEEFLDTNKDKTMIHNYELDLELKHKDSFKEYIN